MLQVSVRFDPTVVDPSNVSGVFVKKIWYVDPSNAVCGHCGIIIQFEHDLNSSKMLNNIGRSMVC